MAEIKCPKCGSPMVIRTSYEGKKFYGCSRYPHCKGTLSYKPKKMNEKKTNPPPRAKINSSVDLDYPRPFVAREKFENYQVRFFENGAVPEDLLDLIQSEEINEEFLKAISQWRIDFHKKEWSQSLTEIQNSLISVMEKILTRGHITLVSPRIESKFKELFKLANPEFYPEQIQSLLTRVTNQNQLSLYLDSKEEKIFYEKILPDILGEGFEKYVIPQVDISSFIPPNKNYDQEFQRVDFAIFHPDQKGKFIVEIDGEQHKSHIEADKLRDSILQNYGYKVIRIPASEIRKGKGEKLSLLKKELSGIISSLNSSKESNASDEDIIRYLTSIKISHQIQLTLLTAIQSGHLNLEETGLWHIISDIDELGIFDKEESFSILKESVDDFIELAEYLCKIYTIDLALETPRINISSDSCSVETENTIYISFANYFPQHLTCFYVQDFYFPYHITNSSMSSTTLVPVIEHPEENDLEYFLQYLFRKPYFLEGQYEGIIRAITGKDALLLLPTGAGKSLVYQLSSLLLPGITIVIDPIISLMEDQIDNLSLVGIDRCIAISSLMEDQEEKTRATQLFGQGEYLFTYISPERLQIEEFREQLRSLTVGIPISLIVIDEAHCVSEWGHDFRTSYLNIGKTSRNLCKNPNSDRIPPLLALTGTASKAVLKDVQRELLIEDFEAIVTPKTFDRAELKFEIIHTPSTNKFNILKGILINKLPSLFNTTTSDFYQPHGKQTNSGLVFCPHVGGEYGVEMIEQKIKNELHIQTDIYSGKQPKNYTSNEYKNKKKNATIKFKRNKIPLFVCTKAFGMGIDKPNIRYTIHYNIPPSIESFYQEAGRAGRDKKTAYCFIIASNDYKPRSHKLLDPNAKIEDINKIYSNISKDFDDDISRNMYFHLSSFQGIENEKKNMETILNHIGDITHPKKQSFTIPNKLLYNKNSSPKDDSDKKDNLREKTEKAIYHLKLLGIISDYTLKYSNDEFTIYLTGASKEDIIETYSQYIESYQFGRSLAEKNKALKFLSLPFNEFVSKMIELLLNFIYEVIEKGRRRALSEMVLLCEEGKNDREIRQRILRYLESTEYSEQLEKLISEENGGLLYCIDVFNEARSPNEAAELRGQVSRYLESYPDHPSLLMLRAISEIYTKEKNAEVVKQNFLVSISSALNNYNIEDNLVCNFAGWSATLIAKRDTFLAKDIISDLINGLSRSQIRYLIDALPTELADIPAWHLISKLNKNCQSLILKKGDYNE